MAHDHNHAHTLNKKILLWSFVIITAYMVIEVVGGILTNSLALMADAGHMLSDAVSLAIALAAFKLGEKQANAHKTFGYKRFEVLAAALNGLTLIAISLYIFYEAIERFTNPPEIASTGMLIISSVGLAINVFVAWLMMHGDVEGNLNMKGAFLHVISDMLGSVGAIIAALCIMFFGWGWADSAASVIVAVLVLRSGYFIMKSAIHLLMEGTPATIDTGKVVMIMKQINGIYHVYDLHIWSITSGIHVLSGRIVVDGNLTVEESGKIVQEVKHVLEHEGIHHVTLQLEPLGDKEYQNLYCELKAIEDTTPHQH